MDDYPGMGGRNAKASLKIQTMYSAINHSITHFDITSGVAHDTGTLPEMIQALSTKELFLADLGYFDTAYLRKIGEQNLFISRIKTNLKVFNAVSEKHCIYEPLNLAQMLKSTNHSMTKRFISALIVIVSLKLD